MHSFEHTPPEARELLSRPIRDLGLRLEGSMLEKYVQQLHAELAAKGLAQFRPAVYLSDEWACPDREPIIGVPFYLADPKIAELERALNDLEDEREILMYLRHEAGHAFNYAYLLYETKEWLDLRPASAFLLEHRKAIVDKITYWTGVRRSLIRHLIETIGRRARELQLSVERKREPQTLVDVVAFATTLAMNYLTRGGFTEH